MRAGKFSGIPWSQPSVSTEKANLDAASQHAFLGTCRRTSRKQDLTGRRPFLQTPSRTVRHVRIPPRPRELLAARCSQTYRPHASQITTSTDTRPSRTDQSDQEGGQRQTLFIMRLAIGGDRISATSSMPTTSPVTSRRSAACRRMKPSAQHGQTCPDDSYRFWTPDFWDQTSRSSFRLIEEAVKLLVIASLRRG